MHIFVDNIDSLSRSLTDSKFALVLSGIESRIEKWLKDENVQNIAFLVSNYATTGPAEFIAETYSKLLMGENLPKQVIELYKQMKNSRIMYR